jgi:hypothetical protein
MTVGVLILNRAECAGVYRHRTGGTMQPMKHAGIFAPLLLALAVPPLSANEPNPGRLLWSFETGG